MIQSVEINPKNDPVVNWLTKELTTRGVKILGTRIEVRKTTGPHDPKKVVEILCLSGGNHEHTRQYNYNKVFRSLPK